LPCIGCWGWHHYFRALAGRGNVLLPDDDTEKPKNDAKAMEKEEEENKISLEENIDELRKTVEAKTPITLETFTAWKKKRAEEKAAEDEKAEKEKGAKKKTVSGVMGQMSGRALFSFDPTMFQDDDEATDDKYESVAQQACHSSIITLFILIARLKCVERNR